MVKEYKVLGKKYVPIGEIFEKEARDFTPWLSENLQELE